MKKILFTLMLLLCGMTTVWAGEGNGTKEHPYTGEWEATAFCPNLKKGDYLAFGCVINGYVTIQDIRLNQKVASIWAAWSPGNLIDDPKTGPYVQYGKDNPPANRKEQSFIVQNVSRNDESQYQEYVISGYFSGFYTTPDADGFVYVESSKQMEIIIKGNENVKGNAQANIILTQDIYLSDIANNSLCHIYTGTLDGDGHTIYGSHDGTRQKRTYLFDYCEGATIKNLTFRNINICNEDDDNQGIIASQASKNCVFDNITFDNVKLDPVVSHVGAIVAQANSCTFKNIKVLNSDFSTRDSYLPVGDSDRYLGMVVAVATGCNFENIESKNCRATADSHIGTVGEAFSCNFNNIEVNNCTIIADDFIGGGVAGSTVGCKIENVNIKSCNIKVDGHSVGGIVGRSNNTNYTNCQIDDQTCIFGDGGIVGGIVGLSIGGELRNCINSALVASDDNCIGGMVGNGLALTDHCLNMGILISIDGDDLDEVFRKYKSKSFGTPITTINYNGKVYQVQQLDEASKELIDNDDLVGGIIGTPAYNSTIKNCINYAPYYSTGDYVGGIVGYVAGARIFNCINAPSAIDGFPDAEDSHGGMIGQVDNGAIDDEMDTPIRCCLNLNGQKMIGVAKKGFAGTGYSGSDNYSNGSSHSSIDKYVSIDKVNSGYFAYLINQPVNALSKEELLPWRQDLSGDSKTIPGFDPTLNVVDYDYLLSSAPTITTAAQLREFADKVNEGHNPWVASLGADITFPENYAHHTIGSKDHPFQGLFEGNGHTISGIKYYVSMDNDGVGLFGAVDANTTIRNVTVDGTCQFTNHDGGAAGIVGLVLFGDAPGNVVIENCASHASILANKHAGGILGRIRTGNDEAPNSKVFIRNCYSNSIITAHDGDSGLLCGYTKDHCSINDCWSAGQLRISEGHTTWPYSIVNPKNEGEVFAGYNEEISLQNCYVVNPDDNVDRYGEYKLQEGVEVVNQRSFEHGEFTYQLNGNTNDVSKSLRWQQELGVDKAPVPGNKGLYHAREIHKDKYGTVCLPYQIKSDEHITYYTFVSDEIEDGTMKLNFEYAETVPAAVPALYLAAEDQTYYFPGAGDDLIYENANCTTQSQTPNSEWMFVGYFSGVVIDDAEVAKSFYYLSDNTIRNAKKITLPPFRAFFHGPSIDELREMLGDQSGQNARVRIVIDGEENEAAALQLVVDDPVRNPQAKSYTLFGTEAGEGYRGIVVRDGKLHFGCLR